MNNNENDLLEIKDDTVDVEEIMANIRQNLKDKGIEEVDFPDVLSLAGPGDVGDYSIDEDMAVLNTDWEVVADRPITSHRKIIGPIIVFFKKVVRKCLRWYINPIVDKQRSFNGAAVRVIGNIKGTQDKTAELEARVANLERELHKGDMVRRVQAVEDNVRILNDVTSKQKEAVFIGGERVRRIEGALKKEGRIGSSVPSQDTTMEDPDFDYFLFEQLYRGSRDKIKDIQRQYLKYFEGKDNILDIGCGRGELLELLLEEGKENVLGIDISDDMITYCKELDLPVKKVDAIEYLESLESGSLEGIYIGQVVEHLSPADMVRVIKLSHDKLKKDGVFIVETVNPMCLSVFALSFYMDPSHIKPVHPYTLEFIMQTQGFKGIETIYFSEVEEKIPELKGVGIDNLEEFNQGIDKLNSLLFSHQDYAIIGWK